MIVHGHGFPIDLDWEQPTINVNDQTSITSQLEAPSAEDAQRLEVYDVAAVGKEQRHQRHQI